MYRSMWHEFDSGLPFSIPAHQSDEIEIGEDRIGLRGVGDSLIFGLPHCPVARNRFICLSPDSCWNNNGPVIR